MRPVGSQLPSVVLGDTRGVLPGTERHPQGRLFKPAHSGDPSKFDLDNWLQSDNNDVVTWHHNKGEFPEYENEGRHDYGEWAGGHVSYGDDDRAYHTDLGYQTGMHFGTPTAGFERWGQYTQSGDERLGYPDLRQVQGHPVRIARNTFSYPSDGTDPQRRWSDHAANHNPRVQDLVESGRTIPYKNEIEEYGSTSYKTLRDTARTWSEDVIAKTNEKSGWGLRYTTPAQQAAAERGMNPVLPSGNIVAEARLNQQRELPFESGSVPRKIQGDYMTRRESVHPAKDLQEHMLTNPTQFVEFR